VRSTGIGASEIAACIGISPYTSPLALYLRKIGELPETRDNAAMEWGRNLEAAVLKRFIQCHPEFRELPAITGRMYRHDERKWHIGTPDAIVWDTRPRFSRDYEISGIAKTIHENRLATPVIVEVKTGTKREGWGREGSDEIPVHYLAQVQYLMALVGAPVAWVPVLLNGRDYREYRVERDKDDQYILLTRGAEFWQRVLDRNPPPADGHVATTAALKGTNFDPELTAQVPADLVKKFKDSQRLVNRIRELMGDAGVAMSGAAHVARRSTWEQAAVDLAGLREEHPDVVAKHTSMVKRSRLTVTDKELT
jgi:putative phage-type endonuclease